jgi:hypothetical protein
VYISVNLHAHIVNTVPGEGPDVETPSGGIRVY